MKKLLTACAIATAFVALPASAQWYIGGGVGSSKLSGMDFGQGGVTRSGGDSSKTSVKVYGGYQITPSWGVEAQVANLGERTVTDSFGGVARDSTKFMVSQLSVAGTATWPVVQNLALVGKLGATINTVSDPVYSDNFESENNTGLLAGVGLAFSITPKLTARLEYEDFGKLFSDHPARASNVSLTVQYAFN